MSTDNLATWVQFARPPLTALKRIGGGRLSGKTDINPQWRYQAMTAVYGPCGIGWKFTVDRQWTEKGHGDEVFAFVNVSLFVRAGEGWSDAIPGNGGSMLVGKEKSGLHNNDEAFKMATTDALGTAMKLLGVAADIYLGNFDGSKYKNAPATVEEGEMDRPNKFRNIDGEESEQVDLNAKISEEDLFHLLELCAEKGYRDQANLAAHARKKMGMQIETLADMTVGEAQRFYAAAQTWKAQKPKTEGAGV